MRFALAVIALVSMALGYIAPASADENPYRINGSSWRTNIIIAPDRSTARIDLLKDGILFGSREAPPLPKGERWFALASGKGAAGYYTSPGGSPLVPDTSTMIAAAGDTTGAGVSLMKYDSSSNLYVTLAGAASITVTIGAGTAAIGSVNITANAAGGYSSTALDYSSSAAVQTVKSGAGTLYKIQWVCGLAMTSTTVFTVYDNTTNSGKVLGIYTFAAGGHDEWGIPGEAFSTGLSIIANATTTQSGCKLMADFQ